MYHRRPVAFLLILGLSLMAAAGCPDAEDDKPASEQGTNGDSARGGGGGGGLPGGGGGDDNGGDEDAQPGDEDESPDEPVVVVVEEDRDSVPYPVRVAAVWAAPAELSPAPEPESDDVLQRHEDLLAEAQRLLAPGRVPANPKEALRVDADGTLLLELTGGGLASVEQVPEMTTFALRLSTDRNVGTTAGVMTELEEVLHPDLVAELRTEGHGLQQTPAFEDKDRFSAIARLDAGGFGLQYSFLYAYARPGHLLVVLQHTPHRTAPK